VLVALLALEALLLVAMLEAAAVTLFLVRLLLMEAVAAVAVIMGRTLTELMAALVVAQVEVLYLVELLALETRRQLPLARGIMVVQTQLLALTMGLVAVAVPLP
jgi:hypothetical protein